jgi:hypothetical protein
LKATFTRASFQIPDISEHTYKELMKQNENTHIKYGTSTSHGNRHFAQLAEFRKSDSFIPASERIYQLIRNN